MRAASVSLDRTPRAVTQGSSPVGIHHLLQLVIEDKLGVPEERALPQRGHPAAGPRSVSPRNQTAWRARGPRTGEGARACVRVRVRVCVCLGKAATHPPGEELFFVLK